MVMTTAGGKCTQTSLQWEGFEHATPSVTILETRRQCECMRVYPSFQTESITK